MDINQPLTLTVEQTAKLLGIGRSTAYELVRTGDIPSLRLGRRIVVPVMLLAELLRVAPRAVITTGRDSTCVPGTRHERPLIVPDSPDQTLF
jgi:excisionase family DNA binding protein